MTKRLQLHLCAECLAGSSAAQTALQADLDASLPGQVDVSLSPCLEQCEAPAVLAMQGAHGAAYVFSGVQPGPDSADIVATCQTYLHSSDGWIEDARPCGRLRFCLAARLPA